jgi:hypothetical protein
MRIRPKYVLAYVSVGIFMGLVIAAILGLLGIGFTTN